MYPRVGVSRCNATQVLRLTLVSAATPATVCALSYIAVRCRTVGNPFLCVPQRVHVACYSGLSRDWFTGAGGALLYALEQTRVRSAVMVTGWRIVIRFAEVVVQPDVPCLNLFEQLQRARPYR